jgi:hypothetical protein
MEIDMWAREHGACKVILWLIMLNQYYAKGSDVVTSNTLSDLITGKFCYQKADWYEHISEINCFCSQTRACMWK